MTLRLPVNIIKNNERNNEKKILSIDNNYSSNNYNSNNYDNKNTTNNDNTNNYNLHANINNDDKNYNENIENKISENYEKYFYLENVFWCKMTWGRARVYLLVRNNYK